MRRTLFALVFLALAAPVAAQDVAVDSAQLERARAEAVRSRGFLRGAETQLTKVLALIDSLMAGGSPDPAPVPDPDPAPDPTPDPDPVPTGAVDWFSDWRGRDGNSYDALHDGGKWNDNLCDDTHLVSIVDAAGRDFPADMDRAYRYQIPNSNECYLLMAGDQWRAPAVGEYAFYRWYMRFEAPQGHAPQDQHFFHQGQYHAGPQYESTFWLNGREACGNGVCADGGYRVTLVNDWFRSDPSWHNILLTTYETYRIELRMWRETAGTARYAVRVFDSSGAELGPEHFRFEYYGPNGWTRLEDRIQQVASADSHFRVIQVGYNGSSPTGNFAGGVYNFIGGVAVRITSDPNGWIGPYTRDGG